MLTPEQVIEQLRVLRQQIPEFVQLPQDQVRQMQRQVTANLALAHEAVSAIGASEQMQAIIGNTPEDAHQVEDDLARWLPVESEFRSMLRGVAAANLVRRHRLSQLAVQAYGLSRQLARQEEHSYLLPHVAKMSQVRKFNRRRAKAEKTAQPSQPQPSPQVKPS